MPEGWNWSVFWISFVVCAVLTQVVLWWTRSRHA